MITVFIVYLYFLLHDNCLSCQLVVQLPHPTLGTIHTTNGSTEVGRVIRQRSHPHTQLVTEPINIPEV